MKPYRLGLYEKAMPNHLTMEQKLLCAKECGYDYLEMSIDETDEKLARLEMGSQQRQELVGLMGACGIAIRSICLSGHRKYPLGSANAEIRAQSLKIMKKAIQLADGLGVRLIQIAGYDVYYEDSTLQTRAYFLQGLRDSVDYAAKYGVVLAFETMETPFMNNVKKAMTYVGLVESPYLQVYPDIGNCTNAAIAYGEDVAMDLVSGRGHLAAMHLKETAPGVFREVEFGTGHVDFTGAISTAIRLGVGMFVTEFWYTEQQDYQQYVKDTKAFIDRQFEKALG